MLSTLIRVILLFQRRLSLDKLGSLRYSIVILTEG